MTNDTNMRVSYRSKKGPREKKATLPLVATPQKEQQRKLIGMFIAFFIAILALAFFILDLIFHHNFNLVLSIVFLVATLVAVKLTTFYDGSGA